MDEQELIYHYPRLYHMASEGSWPSIQRRGLLTTSQLVNECAPEPQIGDQVLHHQRRESIVLTHPDGEKMVVRDQSPLREQFLRRALIDLSVQEWLDVLNNRVFFWLHPDKLDGLLNARRYRRGAHDVLTIDTESLLESHRDQVRLSALNSGATLYPNASPRGSATFQTVDSYPWKHRRKRSPVGGITELAVIDGVANIAEHVLRVERRRRDEVIETLYER